MFNQITPSVRFLLVSKLVMWHVFIGLWWTKEEGISGKLRDCHVSHPKAPVSWCALTKNLGRSVIGKSSVHSELLVPLRQVAILETNKLKVTYVFLYEK